MKRTVLTLATLLSGVAWAQQEDTYDYFDANRQMIRNGVQSVLLCNGLFTSNRPLPTVFRHELAYLTPERFGGPVGTADGGEYEINEELNRNEKLIQKEFKDYAYDRTALRDNAARSRILWEEMNQEEEDLK